MAAATKSDTERIRGDIASIACLGDVVDLLRDMGAMGRTEIATPEAKSKYR